MRKLVTFDVWGTLIIAERDKFQEDICRAVAETLEKYGFNIPLEQAVKIFREADLEVRDKRLRELTYIPPEVSVRMLIEKIVGKKVSMQIVDEVHESIVRAVASSQAVRPAPNVDKLLEKLKELGFKLAVVSNITFWRSQATRQVLARLGILKYIDYEVYADIVKDVKPSARMLKYVEDEANCRIVAHVGDSFTEDVTMALAYRVRAVFIDRRHQYLPEGRDCEVLLNGQLVIVSSIDQLLRDELFKLVIS